MLYDLFLIIAFWFAMLMQQGEPLPCGTFGFFLTGCLCCNCANIFYDGFDREDATDVGDKWTEVSGDWSIASNKLSIATANASIIGTTLAADPDDKRIIVRVAIANNGDIARVIINYTDIDNYDYTELERAVAGFKLRLYAREGGVDRQIGQSYQDSSFFPGDLSTVHLSVIKKVVQVKVIPAHYGGAIFGETANTGMAAGLGTGGTVASAIAFDEMQFFDYGSTCADSDYMCASGCKDKQQASTYEVVITGVIYKPPPGVYHPLLNPGCPECSNFNATYIMYGPVAGTIGFGWCNVINNFGFTCGQGTLSPMGVNNLLVEFAGSGFMTSGPNTIGDLAVVSHLFSGGAAGGILFMKTYTPNSPIDETTAGSGGCLFHGMDVPIYAGVTENHFDEYCDRSAATCTITAI